MIERLFQWLRPGIHTVVRKPLPVILAGLLLTCAGAWAMLHLRIDSDFSKLIPPEYPSVRALEKLRVTVGGENEAAVIIESPSFEANKRFAEAFLQRVLVLQGQGYEEPYFTRADCRHEVDFLQENALYRSIGQLAVLGIGMTLVAALVFLPALLAWRKLGVVRIHFYSGGHRC